MRVLIIIGVALIISACANTGGVTFGQRLSAGIQHYNQTQDEARASRAESPVVQESSPPVTMPVTDWKCMSDCQKAKYKQATCDNLCTSK